MGNVAPAIDATKFLETLKASQLLPATEVEKLEAQFGTKTDPVALAKALVKAGKVTKWQAAQLLHGHKTFQVGNYTLQDQLGANETGRVYVAEHGKLGRKVALKLLPKRLAADPKIVKRFLAEARIAAAIDHRAIMHVFDVDRDAEQVFIVTEYVDGLLLHKYVAQEKPPFSLAMAIFGQLVEGMAVAHEKGVVHGGLRPSTILVDQQAIIKICDLGVASLAEPGGATIEESTEIAADAVTYSAPERNNLPPSLAADIYAIGGILFLLLTGEAPKGSWRVTDVAKSKAISLEVLSELRAKANAVPDAVRKLCALMLAPNPADRPKSCREISKGLPSLMQPGKAKEVSKEKSSADGIPSATPADAVTTDTKTVPTLKTAVPNKPQPKPLPRAKALPAAPTVSPVSPAAEPATPAAVPEVKAPVAKAKPAAPVFPTAKKESVPVAEVVDEVPVLSDSEVAMLEPDVEAEPANEEDTQSGGFNFAINTAPAAAATGGFAINTNKAVSTSGGMPAVQKSAPTVTTSSGENAVIAPTAKSKLPLILGLSIGSSVLALAGVVGVVMMFSGGGKTKQVAQQNGASTNAEKNNSGNESTEDNPAEENPDDEEVNPGEVNPTVAVPIIPTTVSNNPPTTAVPPPAEPVPVEPSEPVPAEPMPSEPAPAEPTPQPEVPKPAPQKPAPKPPSKTEPKPAPKPENKPPAEPFKGFATAIDLPFIEPKGANAAEAMAEVKLGPAVLGNLDCYVDLYGGQFAYKGKQQFTLEAANGGTSTTEWDVFIKAGEDGSGTATQIAKFSAKEESFFFQWLPAAAENMTASHLRNCVLMLRAGKGSHELRLRKPLVVEPLEVSSAKVISGKWPVEAPPDPAHITVELLSAECTIPVVKLTPKEFKAGGELPAVWFGNTEASMPLAIQLKPTLSRQFQLDGLFQYKTELEEKPQGFLRKKLETAYNIAMNNVRAINTDAELRKAGKNQEQRRAIDDQAAALIATQNKIAGAYEEAAKLHESLKAGMTVHFRVLYDAEDGKVVEILTTKAS